MRRNLNQVAAQNTQLIAALRDLAPEAAIEVVKALVPSILALARKQAGINGISPDLIPKDLAQAIQAKLDEAQTAQAAQQQAEQEAIRADTMAAEQQAMQQTMGGGANVPVAAGV